MLLEPTHQQQLRRQQNQKRLSQVTKRHKLSDDQDALASVLFGQLALMREAIVGASSVALYSCAIHVIYSVYTKFFNNKKNNTHDISSMLKNRKGNEAGYIFRLIANL